MYKKENKIIDVQPIRSKEQLEDMKWSLKKWCGERDYILFLLGINTGLRCGDMLKLKKKELKRKKEVFLIEGKTGKKRKILLSHIYEELNEYIDTLESEWLFPSRQGTNPISRTQAYRQLNKAARMVDLESIGTHTMRKTFGYFYYKSTLDIATLQKILNHSHMNVTLRYIGIDQEKQDESLENFVL